jgi:hypothetical protein
MGKVIISAGMKLHCHSKEGVIGAIISYNNRKCALTAYHILKAGNCSVGDKITLNGYSGKVVEVKEEADLAIISIDALDEEVNISKIATPEIGPAYSLNGFKRINCRVMTVGRTYHYLAFPMGNLPLPGDSGSPIIQDGKVVGILASIFYNNATGIALSIDKFKIHSEDNL